eukprot:751373-Hanusia_phi.AAC.3
MIALPGQGRDRTQPGRALAGPVRSWIRVGQSRRSTVRGPPAAHGPPPGCPAMSQDGRIGHATARNPFPPGPARARPDSQWHRGLSPVRSPVPGPGPGGPGPCGPKAAESCH